MLVRLSAFSQFLLGEQAVFSEGKRPPEELFRLDLQPLVDQRGKGDAAHDEGIKDIEGNAVVIGNPRKILRILAEVLHQILIAPVERIGIYLGVHFTVVHAFRRHGQCKHALDRMGDGTVVLMLLLGKVLEF